MKIAISAESTHDLSEELVKKYDVKVIPFEMILDGNVYKDGEMSNEDLFKFVDEHKILPKTTALNEYAYTEYFENLKKDYDAVIHIALSGGITSSYGNAERAAKNVENVFVVDSKTLSTGIGLLVLYARELADEGKTPEEIVKRLEERREKLQVSFVIERLDYLFKGGRCNSLQLLGANLFKIRPSIILKDGKMGMDKKYRGNMPFVVDKYVRDTLNEYNTPDLKRAVIVYPSATPEMISAARCVLIEYGFKEIIETVTRGTVACHCGPNTLGVFYFNDGNIEQ